MRRPKNAIDLVRETATELANRKLAQSQASDSVQFVDITPVVFEKHHRGGLNVLFYFKADKQAHAIIDATYDIYIDNALADPTTDVSILSYTESYVRTTDDKMTICKVSFYVEGSRNVRVVPYIRSSDLGSIVSTQGVGGQWF